MSEDNKMSSALDDVQAHKLASALRAEFNQVATFTVQGNLHGGSQVLVSHSIKATDADLIAIEARAEQIAGVRLTQLEMKFIRSF